MKITFYSYRKVIIYVTIREILNKARNIYYVAIHKNGESKYMSLDELTDKEYDLEFDWFEVTTFWGKRCIEFNL